MSKKSSKIYQSDRPYGSSHSGSVSASGAFLKIVILSAFLVHLTVSVPTSSCTACIEILQMIQRLTLKLTPQFAIREAIQIVCERKCTVLNDCFALDDSELLCERISEQITPLAIRSGILGVLKEGRICQRFCDGDFYRTFDFDQVQESLDASLKGEFQDWKPQYEDFVLKVSKNKHRATSDSQMLKGGYNNLDVVHLLHVTDVHLDLNYTEKASTLCDLPICCHGINGFPENQKIQAKPYGNIKCDLPMKLFDKALEKIGEIAKGQLQEEQGQSDPLIDIVIVTGDNSAHNEWEKTKESVIEVRELVEGKIRAAVQGGSDGKNDKNDNQVIFLTAPGNNEYLPDHQVDPTLYPQQIVKAYRVQIIKEQQQQPATNLTFLSLNTLLCDNQNLFLIQDQTSSIRQLKMLDRLLSQNENVYLFGHIALSSGSCSESYVKIFRWILEKHKGKILGQFYGHTHQDQFIVNSEIEEKEGEMQRGVETSFGFLTGSMSPLGTGTSRFRVYEMGVGEGEQQEQDPKQGGGHASANDVMGIHDYVDYIYRLNEGEEVNYEINYRFKEYYQLISDEEIRKGQQPSSQGVITAETMRNLQAAMESSLEMRKLYASQLTGRASGSGNVKAYCYTYDDIERVKECLGEVGLGLQGQINDILEVLQGPWGSYGDGMVQQGK